MDYKTFYDFMGIASDTELADVFEKALAIEDAASVRYSKGEVNGTLYLDTSGRGNGPETPSQLLRDVYRNANDQKPRVTAGALRLVANMSDSKNVQRFAAYGEIWFRELSIFLGYRNIDAGERVANDVRTLVDTDMYKGLPQGFTDLDANDFLALSLVSIGEQIAPEWWKSRLGNTSARVAFQGSLNHPQSNPAIVLEDLRAYVTHGLTPDISCFTVPVYGIVKNNRNLLDSVNKGIEKLDEPERTKFSSETDLIRNRIS